MLAVHDAKSVICNNPSLHHEAKHTTKPAPIAQPDHIIQAFRLSNVRKSGFIFTGDTQSEQRQELNGKLSFIQNDGLKKCYKLSYIRNA